MSQNDVGFKRELTAKVFCVAQKAEETVRNELPRERGGIGQRWLWATLHVYGMTIC